MVWFLCNSWASTGRVLAASSDSAEEEGSPQESCLGARGHATRCQLAHAFGAFAFKGRLVHLGEKLLLVEQPVLSFAKNNHHTHAYTQ